MARLFVSEREALERLRGVEGIEIAKTLGGCYGKRKRERMTEDVLIAISVAERYTGLTPTPLLPQPPMAA